MSNTVTSIGRLAPLRVVDPITWAGKDLPERRWMVQGLIPLGNVTMLGGDGGLGKSLLALQLMVAASTQGRWLNIPTMPCKTLGIFCEDDEEELHIRLSGICDSLDLSLGDLDGMRLVSRVGEENSLIKIDKYGKYEGESYFYKQIVEQIRDFGAQLIVLDSLHDLFDGNENNRTEARRFIGMLRKIAKQTGGAVVLCSHPSAAGLMSGNGQSGSTAWNNAVRSRLYLSRPNQDEVDADPDKRILSTKKSNYAQALNNLELAYQNGVFVRTDTNDFVSTAVQKLTARDVFLKCLDKLADTGQIVNHSPNSPAYAPRIMLNMPEASGTNFRLLKDAMFTLFSDKQIEIGIAGRGPNRAFRNGIVRVKNNPKADDNE